jgi:hypothetical protein
MREARMVGIAREERVEQGDRRPLLGERRVGARRRRQHRERVIDGDLGIPGNPGMQARHSVGVRLQPRRVRRGLRLPIQRRDGVEESLLPRRARRPRGGLPRGIGAVGQRLAGRTPGEGIAPGAERAAPVRHGAGRVGREDRAKGALAFFPPERVQHRHGVLEAALRLGSAGDREADPSETTQRVVVRRAFLGGGGRGGEEGGEERGACDHDGPQVSWPRMQRRTSARSASP